MLLNLFLLEDSFIINKFIFLFLAIVLLCNCNNSNINLKEGDLLFKQEIDNDFSDAIAKATASIDKYNFTHVAVAHKEDNKWYAIEAIKKGVCMTPFSEFKNPKAIIVIGRLKNKYQPCITKAIDSLKTKIGCSYDDYFSANNNLYYCSELVQQFFKYKSVSIFPTIKMTFKDLKTGVFPSFWVEHFKKLKTPIPEGQAGSNPGQLSKSDKIIILGKY